ncbi:hypothetical protein FHX77_000264 [Bifidobacterium commune]|nr:alpha/beta hydrolase [Bifidobacterium commune]MBB2954884.1 hypothetical protein [Bifidobacterium commune]
MAHGRGETTVVRNLLYASTVCAGALYIAADYFFRFALEPNWPHSLIHSGLQEHISITSQPSLDEQEENEALGWFEEARREAVITAADGVRLHSWILDPDCSNSPEHLYVFCCHGYSGAPAEMSKYAHRFSKLGFTVITPASRCHELSGGKYIGMGALEQQDLLQWIEAVTKKDPKAKILLDGISMGASTVMLAAGAPDLPPNVVAVIADCGYDTLENQFLYSARHFYHIPKFAAKPVIACISAISHHRAGYRFSDASCVDALHRASIPILFIHGSADSFISPVSLERNFRACASPVKQKLMISGAAHTMSASTQPELYWRAVTQFVKTAFGLA